MIEQVFRKKGQVPGAKLTAVKGALAALIGLVLIGVLHACGVKWAVLIGIFGATLVFIMRYAFMMLG